MSITKDQLLFDTTALSDSDSVGAYVRSSDGTLIDHTTTGGKDRLDVTSNMNDGSGNALSSTAGALDVNIDNASIVVTATDLDIRDLLHSTDSVSIGDGTDLMAVNADGSINSVVTATDLDIRDLSASQDNVAISDGTDTLAINADGSINTKPAAANTAVLSGNTGMTAVAAKIVASTLSNRVKVTIQNVGNNTVELGASGVTYGTGLILKRNTSVEMEVGPGIDVYGICDTAKVSDLRVFEVS